jgi:hypothetical protein
MRQIGFVRELRSIDLDDNFQSQKGKVLYILANDRIDY